MRVLKQYLQVTHHQGKRLSVTLLASPEFLHSALVGCIARNLVTTQPLDADDCSSCEQSNCSNGGVGAGVLNVMGVRIKQPHLRSPNRASDRLGMESSLRRILVLGFARDAHLEARHAGIGAVVRDALDDRKTRSAVCTIREWVLMAPIRFGKNLSQAKRTSRNIRTDHGSNRADRAG